MRVYISPSSQFGNKYACGNFNEAETCFQIAEFCKGFLDKIEGIETRMPTRPDTTYKERVNESNEFEADLHLCIHTNAGGGDGTVVFCHPKNTQNTVIQTVYNAVADLTPGVDDGIRPVNTLYEINYTDALCCYVEVEFHDHPTLSAWILQNVSLIGETIGRAVAKAYNYDTEVKIPTTDPESLYRVYAGSYSLRNNAISQVTYLKSLGIDGFVVKKDNMYRVQVGAYVAINNAKSHVQKLKLVGVDSFVE